MKGFPKVKVKRSRVHGQGLFAAEDIAEGTPIIEYTGERVTRAEARRRYASRPDAAVQLLAIDARTSIDGAVGGSDARFANHACSPNAQLLVYKKRVFLVAIEPIAKGEEITYDYALEITGDVDAITAMVETVCSCGSPECRGTMLRI
ncbi:MAG: SET domain-containing protein-lysine N-methyltransferase [Deltaproteobacteria bacterium]|nr:SET domain-containing protein-lysine N-methyltransferase [Deltaproteobacteria bacterium]